MLVRSVPEAPELHAEVSSVHFTEVSLQLYVPNLFSEVDKHNVWNSGAYFPLLYLNLYAATGGLAAGAIAGIFIGAVVFALLLLMISAVIIWHKRSHAKNKKSTNILHAYNHTTVGDLHAECHQVERSQSYAQPLDAITPKDSTHSDNESNTVLQASDRQRFLKRQVCTSLQGTVPLYFVNIVVDKTITRTRIYILQHQNCFFICYSIYIILLLVFFFSSTLTSIRILLLMKRLKQTCPMRHV